ncbi:MAG: hypothetical protein OEZ54_05470 [Gemmatimonadota bacterium]|nr:hypothetical protein [Gemmatimonadota bacterium]
MTLKNLRFKISSEARHVPKFVIEGRDVGDAMRWTGKDWRAVFEEYELADGKSVEFCLCLRGLPHRKCGISVSLSGKEIELPAFEFDDAGFAIVYGEVDSTGFSALDSDSLRMKGT